MVLHTLRMHLNKLGTDPAEITPMNVMLHARGTISMGEHIRNIPRTPYEHLTKTLRRCCERITNTLRTRYEHVANTLRPYYDHAVNTL